MDNSKFDNNPNNANDPSRPPAQPTPFQQTPITNINNSNNTHPNPSQYQVPPGASTYGIPSNYSPFLNTNVNNSNPQVTNYNFSQTSAPPSNNHISNFMNYTQFPTSSLYSSYPNINPQHYQNYQIPMEPDPEFESIYTELLNNQMINNTAGYTKEFFQDWWYQCSGQHHKVLNRMSRMPQAYSNPVLNTQVGPRPTPIKKPNSQPIAVIEIMSDDSDIEEIITTTNTGIQNSPNKRVKVIEPKKSPIDLNLAKLDHSMTKRQFVRSRESFSASLFKLYNETIFDNKLPHDMKINWSKTLNKTAGKTYFQEKKFPDRIERVSWIDLSTKILDSSERLKLTFSHELCHAAAFLIDHNRKAHHGPLWQKWVAKAKSVHPELKITVKHDYEIDYKHWYRCTNVKCAILYKRHSKSVYLDRATCGKCNNKLEYLEKDDPARNKSTNK